MSRMSFFHRLRDGARFAAGAWRSLRHTVPIARHPTRIFPTLMEQVAARHGDKAALISDAETLTYRALEARANRYARWALAQGLAKGEVVCLLMANRPEYLAIWLGITRAGGAVALLNTNLTGVSLAHCVDLVSPRQVIVADALLPALAGAGPHLRSKPKTWVHGGKSGALPRIDAAIEQIDGGPLAAAERRGATTATRGKRG